MSKEKKRPSKAAKAVKKLLSESKLLASANASASSGQEFNAAAPTARTNTKAIKPRPDKKRG